MWTEILANHCVPETVTRHLSHLNTVHARVWQTDGLTAVVARTVSRDIRLMIAAVTASRREKPVWFSHKALCDTVNRVIHHRAENYAVLIAHDLTFQRLSSCVRCMLRAANGDFPPGRSPGYFPTHISPLNRASIVHCRKIACGRMGLADTQDTCEHHVYTVPQKLCKIVFVRTLSNVDQFW